MNELLKRIGKCDFTPENQAEVREILIAIVKELQNLEDNTPMIATSFRGSDLTEEEESALDHLFDMMTAIKQQVLLRKALHNEK